MSEASFPCGQCITAKFTNPAEIKKALRLSKTRILFNEKDCVALSISDLTSITDAQKLKNENKMLNLLTASVSHENLTPLKCIVQFQERLLRDLTDGE